MQKIKKVYPTEHEEQAMFVEWFKIQFPHIRFFAIPNGIRTGFKQASKAKKEGMSSGVPDLYFPKWKIWLEMKREKGGTVSQEQKDWHNYLTDQCNDTVIVARGCDEAVRAIMSLTLNNKS
jgi:hypothetical protein